jgi:hypothetical protein
LELGDDIAMTEVEEDTYETTADPSSFKLYDAQGNEVSVTFQLDGSLGDLTQANLFITGLANPDLDTAYKILIPAGSITCASGDSNSAAYEIEFTLMHTEFATSAEKS